MRLTREASYRPGQGNGLNENIQEAAKRDVGSRTNRTY